MDGALGFNTFEKQDKVLVGLNGGMDAAVTVRILQEQGFAVQAALVHFAGMADDAVETAQNAAKALDITLHVIEAADTAADELLKFQLLMQTADKLDCRFISTGHYARVEQDADVCRLRVPEHAECDQTALLEVLPQEILARLILPLGEFDKESVQEIDAKGEASSTDRVAYVDPKGTPISGAPTTIAYGNISDHKDLSIEGRHFDFLSAKVNGKDCVYIGEYNGVLYYSTDGVIAIKMEDGQKVTMTYQEYYLVTIQEVLPKNCDPGTICTKKGSEDVPVETNKQIRVNAGEDWVVSVTPGAPNNKKRYKITSVTSQNGANITKNAGDDYGATYAIRFQKDDIITIAYDEEGVYRITINTEDNNGFEYINIAHSEKNKWKYLPEQHKLVWTYTEDQVKSDGSIDLPKFHIKRGYRLVHMVLNGETVAAADSNKEVPDGVGSNHGVKGHAGKLIVNAQITNEYTKNRGDETECSFEYSFNVQCTDGGCRDLDFDLAPYQTGQQVLTVRLKTDNRRSGEGIDVVMWDPDQNKLVPMRDNDTVNMDPVGDGIVTLKKRQVRIFFAKPKPGYRFAGVGVDSAQPSGGVNTEGGKSRAVVDNLNNMNATSLGKKGEFQVYDEIWEAAKKAASSAGYEKFLAFAGEKTTHNTD